MSDSTAGIPGYTYAQPEIAQSPFSLDEFNLLSQTVLFSSEDVQYLRMAGEVLSDQVEEVLDVWYGFVGAHPHLLYYFQGLDNQPIADYLQRVRSRFGQWIKDTCERNYDQNWLNYQMEIALRHHRAKKNQTDHVQAASAIIPLRYLIAFIYPITATVKPFLTKQGHSSEEVEKMHQAWFKSVVLQVTLWSNPYANQGDF